MAGFKAGGYDATSSAGVNLVPILKTHEGEKEHIPFLLQTVSFTPEADCHITINGGTQITIVANQVYSNDEVKINNFTVIEGSINYNLVYNY